MPLFYISFATGDGFLGATVVRAESPEGAIQEATERGLNPGGEAAIIEVPHDVESAPDVEPLINRLAGADELLGRGGKRQKDMTRDELDAVYSHELSVVCEHCNS